MTVTFREATREDMPEVVAMLTDDVLGQGRELADLNPYLKAFDAMQSEGGNLVIVGVDAENEIIATCQLTIISGLSLSAARRAQIESVRVASHMRGHGIGEQMFADVEARARAAGCRLIQLTMNAQRTESHRFYERLGFTPSHIGFKRYLD